MNDRKMLMNRVQVCDFALQEAKLFLDSHPDNQEALAFFKKYLELSKEARAKYIEKFGPLVAEDYDGGPKWRWIDDPWPWENSSEV